MEEYNHDFDLVRIIRTPSKPSMILLSKRENSYETWPAWPKININVKLLAKAGFYYSGIFYNFNINIIIIILFF